MAKTIGLSDIAEMLNTKGRIDTIGGSIGCITAMIGKDARDTENTTGNDVKKMQEFICGNGGSLKEFIDQIAASILVQASTMEELVDNMKERRLVKNDVTRIIQKATNSIEKKLDDIVSSLGVIIKSQKGSVNWGNTKKTKDSIEKFKEGLNEEKKMKESRFGKFIEMVNQLSLVSLKDIMLAPFKILGIKSLMKPLKAFNAELKDVDFGPLQSFLKDGPKMFEGLTVMSKLAKKLKPKNFERLYDVLGIIPGSKGKRFKENSVLGIVKELKKLNKKDLILAKFNMDLIGGVIKSMCLSIGVLVLFTPVILVAGLLVKPLEWALFGFKGNGGIIGLFKKLSEHSKDIIEANKSILMMSLGFVALGIGIGVLFAFTRKIEWEQLVRITATIALLSVVTIFVGKVKDEIKDGAKAMIVLALGVGVLGLGLGILFGLTKDIDWEQMAMLGVSILGLGIVTVVLGALNESGLIFEGAIAMGAMGLALIPFGFALKLLTDSVRGLSWNELGMLGAMTLVLGGAVIGLGALMATGFGAIAWGLGLAALGALGLALLPYGLGMKYVSSVAKEIDKKSVETLADSTLYLMTKLSESANLKQRIRAKRNARALRGIGRDLGVLGKSLKTFNDVAGTSIDKAIDAISKIANYFFGEGDGTLSKLNTGFFKRIRARRSADTIGTIAKYMMRLSLSLKTFNDVADTSIDKAMTAINKIANYFFGEGAGTLDALNANWLKRRKAENTAGTIEVISESIWHLATGLKTFNEVADSSIDRAKAAIENIANFFFVELEDMNVGWRKRRKAEKTADTISTISESLYNVSQALKEFNDMGGGVVKKTINIVKDLVTGLFGEDSTTIYTTNGWAIENCLSYLGSGIKKFNEKTSDVDTGKMRENFKLFDVVSNDVLGKWKSEYKTNAEEINTSMKNLVNGCRYSVFDFGGIKKTRRLIETLGNPNVYKSKGTIDSVTTLVNKVNNLNADNADKLKDLFKSFADIGKAGGIFNRFDKRVKQFTEACLELVNAINGNTDAINRDDEMVTVKNANGEEETVKRSVAEFMPKQMSITNVADLAAAIANELNSMSVDCDANVNLQINNENGSEWRITRV